MSKKQKVSSSKLSAVRRKQMLLAALRKKNANIEMVLVSSPVIARTRRLRARWTVELNQELVAYFAPEAEPQLKKALAAYAKKKLNKKLYGKVTIRG